jgi:hypothetical protein
MIYTVTASYGQYEDRCDVTMYTSLDLEDARAVMLGLQHSLVAALSILQVIGHDAVATCEDAVWELAKSASWDGEVYLSISLMPLGRVTHGGTFIESVIASSAYNGDISYDMLEEAGLPTKYELLARPFEMEYYGERIH